VTNPYAGIGPIDHVGIAVTDLDATLAVYLTLGLPAPVIEDVPDQKVRTAIFGVGDGRIELLQTTDPAGPIGKFIAKRGEGIHHLALRVNDIHAKLAELAAKGVQLIDTEPRIGAGGHLIAFIHPKSTGGVLLELTQHSVPDVGEVSRH
jgi:methylmalonyl-CoA/ethylmalonyl-CoA epimerase